MVPDGPETENAVLEALKMGIRHIDTAHAYQNERSVGRAVKESGVPRDEIWITTKLWPSEYGEGNVQIILRWHIQEGNVVFPKTTNPEHMKDNFDIFDFELTEDEMNEIRKLEGTGRFCNVSLEDQERTLSQFTPAD